MNYEDNSIRTEIGHTLDIDTLTNKVVHLGVSCAVNGRSVFDVAMPKLVLAIINSFRKNSGHKAANAY